MALLVAGAAAILVDTRWWQPSPAQSAARGGEVAIPVMTDKARRADVPIFLTGLGTVQAFNSVLIKSRVDGQIVRIRFEEGKDVHAGDVLVEIDRAPFEAVLAQAEANKLKDQAQLDNARLDLARYTGLAKTFASTSQQVDTARALVAQTEAVVKADQALIDTAQVQLNYSTIRSPIDGRVGTRLVDAGNIVKASDTTGIVSINQIHPIFVSFALPADSLPQLSAASKTGDVVLCPGQFVNLRVQLAIRRNVIAVPVTAVQQGPDGPYAFVVVGDRIVQKRPIKVGALNKTTAIIDDGLQPGEQIVTDGQYRIQAGSKVEVAAQTASPADMGPAHSP